MRDLRINTNFFTMLIAIIGAIATIGLFWLVYQHTVSAASQTQYTSIDMSDPWTVVRGNDSGGHTATANSLVQSIDTTNSGADATEALGKTIPNSSVIRANFTIESDWATKPVRAGLWGEVFSAQDPSVISGWPIIEFTTVGEEGFTGFRVYDTRGGIPANEKWYNLTDVNFTYGNSYELKIAYDQPTERYVFYVDNTVVLSLPASRSDNDDSPRDTFKTLLLVAVNGATSDANDNYSATWTDAAYGTTTYTSESETLTNAEDGKEVVLSLPSNAEIVSSSTVAVDENHTDGSYQYPIGLVDFSFTTTTADNDVVLTFVTDLKPSQVVARKYNPNTNLYSTIEGASITETTHNGQHALQLSYTIVDNGPLDLSPAVGTISDPVGLALVPGSPDTGIGNISTAALVTFGITAGALLVASYTLIRRTSQR